MRTRTTLAALLILLAPIQDAAAGDVNNVVIHVDDDAPLGGDGTSWDAAYTFLQDALSHVPQPTEIRIAEGTYRPDRFEAFPDGTGDRAASFELLSGLMLRGGYAGIGADDPDLRDPAQFESVLSGDLIGNDIPEFGNRKDNSFNIVIAEQLGTETVLDGLVFEGGSANGDTASQKDGSALHVTDSTLTMVACTIRENTAIDDGAMYCTGSTLNVSECTITANRTRQGSIAMFVCAATITECSFIENTGDGTSSGGALYCIDGPAIVLACDFQGNTWPDGRGGGATLRSSQLGVTYHVEHCTFTDNAAEIGGGLRIASRDPSFVGHCNFISNMASLSGGGIATIWNITIAHCQFEQNVSGGDAGGCHVYEGGVVSHCSFSGNDAAERGGGLLFEPVREEDDDDVFPGIVMNCLFHDNSAQQGGGLAVSANFPGIVSNITVVNNQSTSDGGGLFVNGHIDPDLSVHNSIICNNTPDDYDCDEHCMVSHCNIGEFVHGPGNINLDPMFVDAENNDFRLQSGSPSIDAGWVNAVPDDAADLDADSISFEFISSDLDGMPRFVDVLNVCAGCSGDNEIDQGAFEYQAGIVLSPIRGDFTNDRSVDVEDLLALLTSYGQIDQCRVDLNLNGVVDPWDILRLFELWSE